MRSVTSHAPKPVSVPTARFIADVNKPMLIFDELKKNDPQLRLVAVMLLAGLGLLLAGLWWVLVVSAQGYPRHLETQAHRTVRLPAGRRENLDRGRRRLVAYRPPFHM